MWSEACVLCLVTIFGSALADGSSSSCKTNTDSPYRKLQNEVFCDYNPSVRPVKDPLGAVQVNASFYLRYISMNEMDNILTAHILIELFWQDEFIRWDPKDYGGIQVIVLDSSFVWVPDLELYNDRYFYGGKSDLYFSHVHVLYTGVMYALPEGEISAHCDLNVYKWPFDRHVCTAFIGSHNYHGQLVDLNFIQKSVKMGLYLNSSSWLLESVNASKSTTYLETSNVTKVKYVRFVKRLTVRRYSSTLFSTVAVPALSCAVLTLICFWMSPENLMRSVCAILSIAGHISFLQYLGNKLPPNASRGILIILLLRDSLILTVLTFIVTCINLRLISMKSPPPHWTQAIISRISTSPAKFILLPDENPTNSSDEEATTLVKPLSDKYKLEWTLVTRLIDHSVFYAFFLTYVVLFIFYVTI